MPGSDDVRATVGATVAGCMVSVGLSAVLGFQTFLYFQIFPSDAIRYKLLVAWIWCADAAHTILICTAIWEYAINNFGNPEAVHNIVPALAATVAITALTTLSVNVFYAWRIHKMSKSNWWLTVPIGLLCLTRTGLAFVTTTEMILTKTFSNFAAHFNIVLTWGLAISATTDIIISSARYYYLRNLKQGYSGTQELVDAVVIFTINDGLLTCAVVIAVIACLRKMPDNFVWLGIYFTIAKFFSNSVVATLNLRNWYRHRPRPLGIPMTRPQVMGDTNGNAQTTDKRHPSSDMPSRMEVFMDQQVEYNVAVGSYLDLSGDQKSQKSSRKSVIAV